MAGSDSYVYYTDICGTIGFVILNVNCSLWESMIWKLTAQTADGENKSASPRFFPFSALLSLCDPEGSIHNHNNHT
jgi:hypothetical protein